MLLTSQMKMTFFKSINFKFKILNDFKISYPSHRALASIPGVTSSVFVMLMIATA